MKILILYQFTNHNLTVDLLCDNLYLNRICADSFNVNSFRFYSKTKNKRPLLLKILSPLMNIPKVRGLLTILYRNKIITLLAKNYSIIDINFFSSIYDNLISDFRKKGKKIKITLWGSDFYRSDTKRKEQQRILYQKVDYIQLANQQMLEDFIGVYPENRTKMKMAHFGNNLFELIEKLIAKEDKEIYKKELGMPEDKLIIACGTNGSEGQQHAYILESIHKLPESIKQQIFLIVPMTYGGNSDYINNVQKKADLLNLSYKIFPTSLTMESLGKLRIISDIAITIQKTDAFSASVQEHIFAGGVMIAGEWLPYSFLDDYGVYFVKTRLDTLTKNLNETLTNYVQLKNICKANQSKIASLSSWQSSIRDWVTIYKELQLQNNPG